MTDFESHEDKMRRLHKSKYEQANRTGQIIFIYVVRKTIYADPADTWNGMGKILWVVWPDNWQYKGRLGRVPKNI